MKIVIGSDHGGFNLKEKIKEFLISKNIDIFDVGTHNTNSTDYPDYAKKVVNGILKNEYESGILICGTGIGMSIVANRYKGIRAALCLNEYMAEMSRKHNNANILVLGGRLLTFELAIRIVEIWLNTGFEAGRHQNRIDKIDKD
ncbi:MAG TPA: ribose 5-phosphate isomerase B [bacterium]|nr:ribose 5-phosphate isomerase B [bacterium]HOL47357.1 ribose 5-phosphate isomerase B [bacterium]HPQ18910.1 ribose 5-phosphate isomerase B [bacterium]